MTTDEGRLSGKIALITGGGRGQGRAHAIAQVELFNTNPIGAMTAFERLEALTAEGGIQTCGNAQNCVKVCPKELPLTGAIGWAGRATTVYAVKKFFTK